MKQKDLNFKNIKNLEDHFVTYLLYLEGKTIEEIAIVRRMDKTSVEQQIIKCKLSIKDNVAISTNEDILIKIISMNKGERVEYLKLLDECNQRKLAEDIYKRYTKFKNPDDKMLLLWTIGELKDDKLLPLLRMELKSSNVNLRRLACSALGKLKVKSSKLWLEDVVKDDNPQVRQYAIKALGHIGDVDTLRLLKEVVKNFEEKEYVKRAAKECMEKIQNSNA